MLAHAVDPEPGRREDAGDRADRRDATLLGDDQRTEGLRDAVRAIDVHVHDVVEVFLLCFHQGRPDGHTCVVHDAVEPAAGLRDRLDRGGDVGCTGDVQSQRLDVLDRVEFGQVLVLARAGVDEPALGRESLLRPMPVLAPVTSTAFCATGSGAVVAVAPAKATGAAMATGAAISRPTRLASILLFM